jgi:hypothetical protein
MTPQRGEQEQAERGERSARLKQSRSLLVEWLVLTSSSE